VTTPCAASMLVLGGAATLTCARSRAFVHKAVSVCLKRSQHQVLSCRVVHYRPLAASHRDARPGTPALLHCGML
jgi:hypothetical protein